MGQCRSTQASRILSDAPGTVVLFAPEIPACFDDRDVRRGVGTERYALTGQLFRVGTFHVHDGNTASLAGAIIEHCASYPCTQREFVWQRTDGAELGSYP